MAELVMVALVTAAIPARDRTAVVWLLAIAALVLGRLITMVVSRYLTPSMPVWEEEIADHPKLRWIPLSRLPRTALCAFFESDTRACVILIDGSLWQVDRLPSGAISATQVG